MPPEDVSDVSEFVPVTTSVPLPLFVKRVVFVTLSSVWVSPSATVYVSPRTEMVALAATATVTTNAKDFFMNTILLMKKHSIPYCRPGVNYGKSTDDFLAIAFFAAALRTRPPGTCPECPWGAISQ